MRIARIGTPKEGKTWRRCHCYVDLVPRLIDGDDADDPIVSHIVRKNAVIDEERKFIAPTLAHPGLSKARADDLRRHVLRNRPRSVKS